MTTRIFAYILTLRHCFFRHIIKLSDIIRSLSFHYESLTFEIINKLITPLALFKNKFFKFDAVKITIFIDQFTSSGNIVHI